MLKTDRVQSVNSALTWQISLPLTGKCTGINPDVILNAGLEQEKYELSNTRRRLLRARERGTTPYGNQHKDIPHYCPLTEHMTNNKKFSGENRNSIIFFYPVIDKSPDRDR